MISQHIVATHLISTHWTSAILWLVMGVMEEEFQLLSYLDFMLSGQSDGLCHWLCVNLTEVPGKSCLWVLALCRTEGAQQSAGNWALGDITQIWHLRYCTWPQQREGRYKKEVECRCSYQSRSRPGRDTCHWDPKPGNLGKHWPQISWEEFLLGSPQSWLSHHTHIIKKKRHSRPPS